MCQCFAQVFYESQNVGVKVAYGGTSIVFVKEIGMLRKYKLHARVISWSPKWVYVQGVFTLPANGAAFGLELPSATSNPNADPVTVSGTSTPVSKAGVTVKGETVCAVAYGRYVFKETSGKTMPMADVLKLCGYTGDDEEIERRRVEGWEYVQGLEHDWDKDRVLQSASDI
jgi:hypothetical protein